MGHMSPVLSSHHTSASRELGPALREVDQQAEQEKAAIFAETERNIEAARQQLEVTAWI